MKMLQGIAASHGIAIGRAFVLEKNELKIEKQVITDTEAEWQQFLHAVDRSEKELIEIRDQTREKLGEEHAQIFSSHLLVLKDPEMMAQVKDKIQQEKVNATYALQEVAHFFIQIFEQMDNAYMRERSADIRDVTERVLRHLMHVNTKSLTDISEPVIVISDDLTPSETAQLNRNFILGFATNIGGRTSHAAIMSRSLELPAIVGTNEATTEIQTGDFLILDGIAGKVLIAPDDETIAHYKKEKEQYEEKKRAWEKLKDAKSETKDGHHVELMANIGSPEDIESVLKNGGEGVGLFRTEFLYMGKSAIPSEEEQFEAYKTVLEALAPRPVVVRTLDIGGDKSLPYFEMPHELNPFLGFRAIRLTMKNMALFRPQLRALLRASVYGNLKIMFPMIATIDEFREAKNLLLQEKEKLQKEGYAVSEQIEVGIMVEIPAAALCADILAKEVDFMSIGTNDLIQYTMAADRMNENVSYLYQPFHPAVLRLIRHVIESAHKEGKWAGMCGEMAGDQEAIPILLKLGLDEFSMSATSILPARSLIRSLNMNEIQLPDEIK